MPVGKAAGAVAGAINSQFRTHALDQITARGGSKLHALLARGFGKPLGPQLNIGRDGQRMWSYNFATKYTRVAINSNNQITTYIRFTSKNKWWRF